MTTTYSMKLKDPRWQRRRLERLQAADWSCEECDAKDETLHVHHMYYVKGREPWEYRDLELRVLCDGCHADWHRVDDFRKALAAHVPTCSYRRAAAYMMFSAAVMGELHPALCGPMPVRDQEEMQALADVLSTSLPYVDDWLRENGGEVNLGADFRSAFDDWMREQQEEESACQEPIGSLFGVSTLGRWQSVPHSARGKDSPKRTGATH